MRHIVFALSGVLLLTPVIAAAQQFSSLEERMTYNEFRAAGLEKLSAEELAALNAWLRKDLPQVAASAAATAQPIEDRRGFPLSASDQGPEGDITSRIPGEFRGWSNKQRFTLENGQVWQVNDSTSTLAGIKLQDPVVTLSRGVISGWFLSVEGYNARARVKRIK